MQPESKRDAFRALTLGAKKSHREQRLSLKLEGGAVLEAIVRQPSVEARGALLDGCSDVHPKTKEVKVNTARLQVDAVIASTYTPEGERAYEEADREALLKMPAGGWFDELAKAAVAFINVDLDESKKD